MKGIVQIAVIGGASVALGLSLGSSAVRNKAPRLLNGATYVQEVVGRRQIITAQQRTVVSFEQEGEGARVKAAVMMYDTQLPYLVIHRVDVFELGRDSVTEDSPVAVYEFDPMFCGPGELVVWEVNKEIALEPGTYLVGFTVTKNGRDVSSRSDIVTIPAK